MTVATALRKRATVILFLLNFICLLTSIEKSVIITTVEQPFNYKETKMKNYDQIPECECHEEHKELIIQAQGHMPEETVLYDLSDFFKVLGDSTRLGILFAIDGEPMCVCDIAAAVGMTKSAVSHQLKVLRQNCLVKYKKVGKNVFYELSDDHVRDIIEKALDHIQE